MAQVTLRINGYAYTLGCQDGEEDHLQAMAAEVDRRIDSVKASAGPSGEARMLVIAALLMADDVHEMRQKLAAAEAGAANPAPAVAAPSDRRQADPPAGKVGKACRRHCGGAGASLSCTGGAAGCDRQHIPRATKHLPGSWLCRDLGPGIWRPPAQQALGG